MYYDDDTIIFLNGKWIYAREAKTGLYKQSFHYGNGVFEGIRAYATHEGHCKILKAREHFERLQYSAEQMYMDLPYSVDEMVQWAYALLAKNNLQDAYIRPLVFTEENMGLQPENKTNLFMCAWNWGQYFSDLGVNLVTSEFTRPDPRSCRVEAKVTGHYTNSILALNAAKKQGYDEALLLDQEGFVAEASGANFFFQKGDVIFTAPRGNILPGITRSIVFDLCRENGYTLRETRFKPEDVYDADGAFLTGTAAEISAVSSLDGIAFKRLWKDTFGYRLQQQFMHYVRAA
ncbi:branched-chain amino acid transaminase [Marinicella sp. W31]|uniref:branched-chain amino acid transaminase n=1 Tax=Marinicella sp. W31 TaxID=3023713 RepID=UPI003756C5AE